MANGPIPPQRAQRNQVACDADTAAHNKGSRNGNQTRHAEMNVEYVTENAPTAMWAASAKLVIFNTRRMTLKPIAGKAITVPAISPLRTS